MHADMISSEPRALIVEDESLIAEELRERLSRLGFSVIAAV
jgi:DNA-binding response OmpR family regulator